MKITHEITLDVARHGVQATIPLTQHEAGVHRLIFDLYNGSVPIVFGDRDRAVLYVDGDIYDSCIVYTENGAYPNCIVCNLSAIVTKDIGERGAVLQIYKDSDTIAYSPEICLVVREDKTNGSKVLNSPQYSAVVKAQLAAEQYAKLAEQYAEEAGDATPHIRISKITGNWEISRDGGETWEDTGMNSTGVHVGSQEPTEPGVNVWIDPNGNLAIDIDKEISDINKEIDDINEDIVDINKEIASIPVKKGSADLSLVGGDISKNKATGKGAAAFGMYGTRASGFGAFVAGMIDTTAYPNGVRNIKGVDYEVGAPGVVAASMGGSNIAAGTASASFGAHCASLATRSFTAGYHSCVLPGHDEAIAVGKYLNTGAKQQAVFGAYNKPNANALLQIGGGTSDTNRTNAFEVGKENGKAYVDLGGNRITLDEFSKLNDLAQKSLSTETWTFTLENESTVTKKVYVG